MDEDENIVVFDIIRSYNEAMAARLRQKKYRALGVRSFDTSKEPFILPGYNHTWFDGSQDIVDFDKEDDERQDEGTHTVEICAPSSRSNVSIRFPFSDFVCGTSVSTPQKQVRYIVTATS
jgi:hypothetical protein